MKTLLVAIDAKYIHPNLAVRSLKANTAFDVEIAEFTIKDSPDEIAKSLLDANADVYGFSVYLWNVRIVKRVLDGLRPRTLSKIILGGPEVTYDHEPWIQNNLADFVVLGEGEIAFDRLLKAISTQRSPADIPNLAFLGRADAPTIQPIGDLRSLKSPHRLEHPDAFYRTKIQYVEASRGCPYRCSYCLASLEKPVRFLPIERVKDDLLRLIERGARTIKFLDRTFNANKHALEFFAFLIEHRREDLSIQFEMTGDLLPDEIVDYVNEHAPKGLFRFEIGVQSTDEATNRRVDRIQNTERLFAIVRKLLDKDVVDLHLDLIAGLPGETLARFRQTFDETYALGAKELQLGVLKLLKGTKIRAESKIHGYVYDPMAPYVIESSKDLSKADLETILRVEAMLDRLHNKGFFRRTLEEARKKTPSMFDWFASLSAWFSSKGFDSSRVDLTTLFSQTDAWLELRGERILRDLLKWDYLERFPRKPKIWWKDDLFEDRAAWIEAARIQNPLLKDEDKLHQAVLLRIGADVAIVWYDLDRVQSRFLTK